jgi:hypothetical protein
MISSSNHRILHIESYLKAFLDFQLKHLSYTSKAGYAQYLYMFPNMSTK